MGKIKSEVENEVYSFIKILIVVVLLILGVYFFTNAFVNKEYDAKENIQDGVVSSNSIIVGSIFNRPYKEYYVLAYKGNENDAVLFDSYVNLYESKENALRIYTINLDNVLNSGYYSEKGNSKAQKLDELKISSPTLIKIKSGNISKYIEGQSNVKKELGI